MKKLNLRPKDLILTLKMLIHCKTSNDAQMLDFTAQQYTKACNYISQRYFDNDCKSFTRNVRHNLYFSIRSMFGLKAQQAGTVFKTIRAKYRTVNTQLTSQTHRYKDKYNKHTFYINKTVHDLTHPIKFHKNQLILQRKNDWSLKRNKHNIPIVSINTLKKRRKFTYYIPKYFRKYTKAPWSFGTAHYIKKNDKRYLHINVKCKISALVPQDIKDIVGNDRGQRFLTYEYNPKDNSYNIKGLGLRKKRSHFLKQRAILQHKRTRSAKRKLQNISGQENCWMHNVDHCASKALIRRYGSCTAYILENLRGVKFEAMNASKQDRYSRATWTFYALDQDLTYKALEHKAIVLHINPQYTSQRCPKCGCVMKASRNHNKHIFICQNKKCGYKSNDDRIGAMNIQFLGKLRLLGYKKPFIKKDNQIGYHIKRNHRNVIKYLSRLQALKVVQRPIK